MNVAASTFCEPKQGTAGCGYCQPMSAVVCGISWMFDMDMHEAGRVLGEGYHGHVPESILVIEIKTPCKQNLSDIMPVSEPI